jgi:hypothetical protein
VELGFYVKGAGSCRWESYDSARVYANGSAQFPPDAMWARSDFYLLGGQALGPKLTGCVPQVCPHLPPWHTPIGPPIDPPKPPKPPAFPNLVPFEVSMTPASVAVIGPNGLFGSVDPSTKQLVFDRTTVGGWETFTLEKPDDRGRLQLTSKSAPDVIIGVDTTKYGSNDVRKLFYMKPADKRGNYESFFVGRTPNKLILAMIEYIDQGVQTQPYAAPNLTVVEL